MAIKTLVLKEAKLTAESGKTFTDDKTGKTVEYTEYKLVINGRGIKVNVKGESKTRFNDLFENVKAE